MSARRRTPSAAKPEQEPLWQVIAWRIKDLSVPVRLVSVRANVHYERLTEFLKGNRELRSDTVDRILLAVGLYVGAKRFYTFPEVVKPLVKPIWEKRERSANQQDADSGKT